MPEHSGRVTTENFLNGLIETFADSVPKQSSATLFERSEKSSVSESFNRLFGRQKPVHHLLGGGKSADVLLWRNKRISGGVLAGATFIWLLLEWLNYHLLTLICMGLVLSMTILFLWSNVSFILNRSPARIPRIALPEEMFINAAITLRNDVNGFLRFLQDVASGRDLKTFLVVAGGEEVIILAHGFGTDQSVWKHVIPHLVQNYRLVIFDNMGAGTTNPDYFDFDRYSTFRGYAYDLLAILDELKVDSCIFVGHSVSGLIGCLASIEKPHLFTKMIMISMSPRYLNDVNYFGGFEQEDLNQLFEAMQSNFKAWVSGFAPLAVGADMDSMAVQEFSRTLFNVRPDIALSVAKTIFQCDMRDILPHVTVPCHILQSSKDLAVPVVVSEYIQENLGGKSTVEILPTEGHLPQMSSPDIVVPVLIRHIRGYI